MNLSVSTVTNNPELSAIRTQYPAYTDFAVKVFLADSHTILYLTVAEARTLAARLLAATDNDTTEVDE